MADKQRTNIHRNSRLAVAVVMAVLFVLGLILVAQGFIDTRNYQQAVIDAIHKQTGKTVTIKGKVRVALLPTPTLYIPGIELRDPESSEHPGPAANVELIRIKVPVFSIFSDHPRVSKIVLESPVLELVKSNDKTIHWDWLNTSLMKAFADQNDPGNPLSVDITDGKIIYRDSQTDEEITIEAVNLSATNGKHLEINGGFSIFGHALQCVFNTDPGTAKPSDSMTPFALEIKGTDKSVLALKGGIDISQDLPDIQGTMNLNLPNALTWVHANVEEGQELLKQVTNTFRQKKNDSALPLQLTSAWVQHGLSVDMTQVQLQGLGSTGGGAIHLAWQDWQPVLTSEMKFSAFNYEQWKKLFTTGLGLGPPLDENTYNLSGHEQENPLPKNFRVSLNLLADQFIFGQQLWKNASLSADLSDGAVTVNQFNIELPGDARLSLFGIISQAPTGDMRFEGSMETDGKSLRDSLTVFDPSAAELPQTGFGLFRARANIFLSAEQLRLSEADVRLSDLHLNGGLAAYFDTKPRIEADVNLKDINFDYFRDAWREKEKNSGRQDFFLKFDKSLNFNWLKRLQTAIDFHVSVDGFTFLERKGTSASFRLYAQQDEVGLHDINFVYPTDAIKGVFTLKVSGEQPAIELTLSANGLNTDYFNIHPAEGAVSWNAESNFANLNPSAGGDQETLENPLPPQPSELEVAAPPKPASGIEDIVPKQKTVAARQTRWPEELLDMSWMDGFSGVFDLNIGRLVNGGVTLDNVRLQANLSNDLVTFKTFTFTYWGGQCSVLGSVYGGKVPGLSLNAVVTDADLHTMLHSLARRDNITGNVSLSATMSASGVNYISWLSQSSGKILLSARGVNVNGLNLQGVVDAVTVSRTAADVFNSVNLALPTGATLFSVDGGINLKDGIMKTPGITLKTDNITGNLSGEVKLIPWTMELSTMFQFPAMSSETVPTLTVQLAGPLENPELRTDTSSLEAFVAKRIISK